MLWLALATPTLAAAQAPATRPNLYVYLHTDAKSANLESGLREKLPAVNVTVFGRFRDFEEAMTTARPDALLALRALVLSQNLTVSLQGVRGNQDWEPYALLSTGAPMADPLAGKAIGVVDLLGRRGTQDFVAELLGTPDVKLKRVTKLEDLLPLLQVSAADAILISVAEVKSLTERSRLPLARRDLPNGKVGLAAVAVLNPAVRDVVVKAITSLDAESNRTLGVERWRAP